MTVDTGPTAREVGPAARSLLAPVGTRWAVIVGISKYQSKNLNLRFAHRDAMELCELLRKPEGGNFAEDHIRLLCDDKATTAAITRALRGFLLEAGADDLILLFFACHGGPDPRRPAGPLYLYTHDTDASDVAGTALPMDDIYRSLEQLISARRVVIIADTCQSAGIGGGPAGRAVATAEATNRYLDRLARAHEGVALLTSAAASESSLEDRKWGKGHGVFTHYLLEGMRGAADGYGGEKDGIVSIRELFEYVRDQVQQATQGSQHPTIGTTRFDPMLPMAVTGDLDVEQHLALAHHLREVGWLLDDPAPMLLAARQFGLAAELKRVLPSADAERGRALLAAEDFAGAADVLSAVTKSAPAELPASAWLELALAQTELGRLDGAATAVTEFMTRTKADGEELRLAKCLSEWLGQSSGRVHALLIAVGKFPAGTQMYDLEGPPNDVRMMSDVLTSKFGVEPTDGVTLLDSQGTRAKVLREFKALRSRVRPNDAAVVYFSGHSLAEAVATDTYLVTHDRFLAEGRPNGISVNELLDAISLPARAVVVILDTHVSAALFDEFDRRGNSNTTLLLACGVGEIAYEVSRDGQSFGLFTAALADELHRLEPHDTYRQLIDAVQRAVEADPRHSGQTAQLVGPADAHFLSSRFPYSGLWHAVRRAVPRSTDEKVLEAAADDLDLSSAHRARARQLIEHSNPSAAVAALERAVTASTARSLELALALIDLDDAAGAAAALDEAATLSAADRPALEALGAKLRTANELHPAIVVIDPVTKAGPESKGSDTVKTAMRLAEAVGSAPDDVDLVLGDDATVDAVRLALANAEAMSRDRFVIVAYIGKLIKQETYAYPLADRVATVDQLWPRRRGRPDRTNLLGLVLDYSIVGDVRDRDLPDVVELNDSDDLGFDLALAGVANLVVSAMGTALTTRETYGEMARRAKAVLLPPEAATQLVGDRAALLGARRGIDQVCRKHAVAAAALAQSAIEQHHARHEEHPEGHLQRGLALAALDDRAGAISSLRAARNLYEDPSIRTALALTDPATDRWQLESRYHYGRLVLEDRRDLYDVVATLQAASIQAPDDPRILLMLVQAIRELVERESLVQAREHARKYLRLGAPLGDGDVLRAFIRDSQLTTR